MLIIRGAALGGFLAVMGLAGTALAQSSDVPRTPWGHPDMQGLWTNSTTTPLEALTEEEQARGREAQRPVWEATAGTGAAFPEQRGPLDRPSLIIDPPDGRIRMTDKAIQRLVARENAREGDTSTSNRSMNCARIAAVLGACRTNAPPSRAYEPCTS